MNSPDDEKKMTAGNGGQLNPAWVEWLMGWPKGWTDLKQMGGLPFWNHWQNWCLWQRMGIWWDVDPADHRTQYGIPRTAANIKNRKDRLKALGNGQVPAVVKMAWELLT